MVLTRPETQNSLTADRENNRFWQYKPVFFRFATKNQEALSLSLIIIIQWDRIQPLTI